MAARTLWKFVVGRAKTLFKNYNVVERAENTMENVKRVSPRHPGTEAKFKVLIKERPEIHDEMEKKPFELLDRLKIVKVSSEGGQDDVKGTKPLPEMRVRQPPPIYGYEEPDRVSEGKCTIRQALQFISNHQSDPSPKQVDSIAKEYNMKTSDIENIVENFRVFELYIPRDENITLGSSVLQTIGARKVKKALYAEPFEKAKPDVKESTEEKKKQ